MINRTITPHNAPYRKGKLYCNICEEWIDKSQTYRSKGMGRLMCKECKNKIRTKSQHGRKKQEYKRY